jgi:hypothetical protein
MGTSYYLAGAITIALCLFSAWRFTRACNRRQHGQTLLWAMVALGVVILAIFEDAWWRGR